MAVPEVPDCMIELINGIWIFNPLIISSMPIKRVVYDIRFLMLLCMEAFTNRPMSDNRKSVGTVEKHRNLQELLEMDHQVSRPYSKYPSFSG